MNSRRVAVGAFVLFAVLVVASSSNGLSSQEMPTTVAPATGRTTSPGITSEPAPVARSAPGSAPSTTVPEHARTEADRWLSVGAFLFGLGFMALILRFLQGDRRRSMRALREISVRGQEAVVVNQQAIQPGATDGSPAVRVSISGPASVVVGIPSTFRAEASDAEVAVTWTADPQDAVAPLPKDASADVVVTPLRPASIILAATFDSTTLKRTLQALPQTGTRESVPFLGTGWGSITIVVLVGTATLVLAILGVLDGQATAGILGTLAGVAISQVRPGTAAAPPAGQSAQPLGGGHSPTPTPTQQQPQRTGPTQQANPAAESPLSVSDPSELVVGGGRRLPRLLFVTQPDALAVNIGLSEAALVVGAVRSAGESIALDPGTSATSAVDKVRSRLERGGFEGVVLVGGYDVVPSLRVDVLSPALRSTVDVDSDADYFIVWSDDGYGDIDGDTMPELPVSRVPDGHSANVLMASLAATYQSQALSRFGIRNVRRPFADDVFRRLHGRGDLHVSEPTVASQLGRGAAQADTVYLMLHGDWIDGSRFWGEETPGNTEAVNTMNVPDRCGGVVFTGCCWGALTVDQPAGRVAEGRPLGVKSESASLALTFLRRGAVAFVGCTGSHYSPLTAPFDYFGKPMHDAFFERAQRGVPPARSLFEAKEAYAVGMPHGQVKPTSQAVEHKILRQFTCLGLGW